MKLITSHIEYLLTENDCVIVPGFGGFVIQNIEAQFMDSEVLPPAREICFNAGLTHDDGLLLTNISQVEGVSYGEARRMVQNDLELFSTELSYRSKVELGKVGAFTLDESKNLVFESTSIPENDIHSFGLTSVKLALLSELTKRDEVPVLVTTEKDGDMIQIRFSKRKALRAVASVAAVWLLWIFSTPVTDVKQQTAGFISRQEIIKSITPTILTVNDSTARQDSLSQQPVAKVDAPKAEVTTQNSLTEERYFIVLGSFHSEKSATKHLDQLTNSGIRNVKVQKLGTLMRTTLCAFVDKAEAEKYLSSIRYNRHEYNEAWLYCKK
ncbi:MAG: SPOR domain-containing protein [Bacteroidales bacterium]